MNRFKEQRPDPEQLASVASRADTAIAAVKAEFAATYDPAELPAFALATAGTVLRNAAAGLEAKLLPVVVATQERAALATRSGQELAVLSERIKTLRTSAPELVREPANVLDAFRAAIIGLTDSVRRAPDDICAALVATCGLVIETPVIGTTTTRKREAANQAALAGALRRVLAIEAARLAPLVRYVCIEDANAGRSPVVALLDEQAQIAGETVCPTLVALRAEVVRAIPGRRVLPQLITITQPTEIPLTALVYNLYGPVDPATFERLCADIIARNKIRHPGFVSGDLKVVAPTDSDRAMPRMQS